MLSQARFKLIEEELNSIRDFTSIIRISTKNATDVPSLRRHDFVQKYQLKHMSYVKLDIASKANEEIHSIIDEISFFYYVSQFERICFDLANSGIKQIKEFHAVTESNIKNTEAFIKDSENFFPFSTISYLFDNSELDFIKELVAVRNYIAHGKKDIKLLKTNDENPNAPLGLVNNIDQVHDKCISLIKKVIKD